MNAVKKLIPSIFIHQGQAVKGFQNFEVISNDVVELALQYCDAGADELLIFDLSNTDEEHDFAIDLMKKIARVIHIPMIAGGNIKRQEDVKKILYAGADRAFLNLSKENAASLVEEVSKRFGKDRIVASFSTLETYVQFEQILREYADELIFIQTTQELPKMDGVNMPCMMNLIDADVEQIADVLKNENIIGVSGGVINSECLSNLKKKYIQSGIDMYCLSSEIDFRSFKVDDDGLVPVVVQDYVTNEVLMMAYMNQESFEQTLRCGKMTYYSRSRKALWLKGETSGHYQYVKSLTVDCDKDTILAKVEQIGVACHTGNPTCFFTPLVKEKHEELNPLKVFESVYDTIMDRKLHPKEGSYTNYLFDKGIDKILKKVGEEATELVIAAKNPNPEEIKYELSDFLYHAMVLMVERGVTWDDIVKELADR